MAKNASVRLDDELEERLDEFREDQYLTPDQSTVIRAAIDEFLEKRGY